MKHVLICLAAMAAGCSGLPDRVSGLRPVSPLFTTAEKRPTLRWEPFPTPEVPAELIPRIRDVVYDLRLKDSSTVYSREGLPGPEHVLEEDLMEDRAYTWTIRARFSVDGRPRATQWTEGPPYRGRSAWIDEPEGEGIPLSVKGAPE